MRTLICSLLLLIINFCVSVRDSHADYRWGLDCSLTGLTFQGTVPLKIRLWDYGPMGTRFWDNASYVSGALEFLYNGKTNYRYYSGYFYYNQPYATTWQTELFNNGNPVFRMSSAQGFWYYYEDIGPEVCKSGWLGTTGYTHYCSKPAGIITNCQLTRKW